MAGIVLEPLGRNAGGRSHCEPASAVARL